MAYPSWIYDQFRQRYPGVAGPGAPAPVVPTDQGAVTFGGEEPVRLDPEAYQAWRRGATRDIGLGLTANPVAPVAPVVEPPVTPNVAANYPEKGVAAVPYSRPVVQQTDQGITLNTSPVSPGWEGTVAADSPLKSFGDSLKKIDTDKLFAGLEEINKGIKNKQATDSGINTITPVSSAPIGGGGGGTMGAELLAQILKRNRGLTLTGRG